VNAEQKMNDNEMEIMTAMSDSRGFPTVYGSGDLDGQPYIVQQKLGLNINDLLRRNKKHFTLKTVVTIGIQLLENF
jgi:hypothetical protein